MTILETIIFVANEIIGRDYIGAVDAGDTIFVHLFGAYFGLTVSRVLYNPAHDDSPKQGASYTSDMFSMVSRPLTFLDNYDANNLSGWHSFSLDVLAQLQWRGCSLRRCAAKSYHQHILLPLQLHHCHCHHQLPGVKQ